MTNATLYGRKQNGVALLIALVAASVAAASANLTRSYTAELMFFPLSVSGTGVGAAGSVLADLGLPRASAPWNSPDYYAEMIESDAFLLDLLRDLAEYGDSTGLSDEELRSRIGGISQTGSLIANHIASQLRDRLQVRVSSSGVVRVSVRAADSAMATLVAHRVAALVDEITIRSRQALNGSERRFLERRLVVVESDLEVARDSLVRFLEANRLSNSPTLAARRDNLLENVRRRGSVVEAVAIRLESARADEIRETPAIVAPQGDLLVSTRAQPHAFLVFVATLLVALVLWTLVIATPAIAKRARADLQGRVRTLVGDLEGHK